MVFFCYDGDCYSEGTDLYGASRTVYYYYFFYRDAYLSENTLDSVASFYFSFLSLSEIPSFSLIIIAITVITISIIIMINIKVFHLLICPKITNVLFLLFWNNERIFFLVLELQTYFLLLNNSLS